MNRGWSLHDLVHAASEHVADRMPRGAAHYAEHVATAADCRSAAALHIVTSEDVRARLIAWATEKEAS